MKIILSAVSKILNVLFLSVAFLGMIIMVIPAAGIVYGVIDKFLSQ